MIRRWAPVVVVTMLAAGYGGYGRSALAADPWTGVRGAYLMVYGVMPVMVLVGYRHAVWAAEPTVVLRSGSAARWCRARLMHGAENGAVLAGGVMVGTALGSLGLAVPAVGPVAVTCMGIVAVCIGLGAMLHGVAAVMTLTTGRSLAAVAMIALWVLLLVAGRSDLGVNVWAQPHTAVTRPMMLVHFVWPIVLILLTVTVAEAVRRGDWRRWLHPALVYAVVAVGAVIAQAFSGSAVVLADGSVDRVHDPIRGVLVFGPGSDLRALLFFMLVQLGYPLAFAVHFREHRNGPWLCELIRAGSLPRSLRRLLLPWGLLAAAVPALTVGVALIADRLLAAESPPELTVAAASHILLAGTVQMWVYLVASTIVMLLTDRVSAVVGMLLVLTALGFGRIHGYAIPFIAAHGLPVADDSSMIVSLAFLVGACVVLAVTATIVASRTSPERSMFP